jgi:hypothetical protein
MLASNLFQIALVVGLFWMAKDSNSLLFDNSNSWIYLTTAAYLIGVLMHLGIFRMAIRNYHAQRLIIFTGPSLLVCFLGAVRVGMFLIYHPSKEMFEAMVAQNVPDQFTRQWEIIHENQVWTELANFLIVFTSLCIIYIYQARLSPSIVSARVPHS